MEPKRPAVYSESAISLGFYDFLIGLLDPLILFPPHYELRIRQKQLTTTNAIAYLLTGIWFVLFLVAWILNDPRKTNFSDWTTFRLTVMSLIVGVGVLLYSTKRSLFAQQLLIAVLAGIIAASMSWAMRIGPIRSSIIIIWPAVILAAGIRSPAIAIALLAAIFGSTRPLWAPYYQAVNVLTDVEISVAIILAGYAFRIMWFKSAINDERLKEASARAVEVQIQMEAHLTRFISPVLVENIHKFKRDGQSLSAAIDTVLQRTKQDVAVLYSDFRSYSEKSKNFNFIEEELIPSAVSIIDEAEENLGVAKQVGDAVIVYYALIDPEESLLRCIKDAFRCTLDEHNRVIGLGRSAVDRYFTVSFATGYVGNMASERHREPTVLGTPPNLAARVDALTKEPVLAVPLKEGPAILLTDSAVRVASTFSGNWKITRIDVVASGLTIRSFPEERYVGLLRVDPLSIQILNQLLSLNGITPLNFQGTL